jgi:hypothetical protein
LPADAGATKPADLSLGDREVAAIAEKGDADLRLDPGMAESCGRKTAQLSVISPD